MFKLFHFHEWEVLSCANGSTTFGTGDTNRKALVTVVLFRCKICKKYKTERLEGHWDLSELL